MMRDEIWYREELVAFRALVVEEVGRGAAGHSFAERIALGGLLMKLDKAIETAPSARTKEGVA